jgi:arginine decarboxylase
MDSPVRIQSVSALAPQYAGTLIGMRIPKDFFVSSGTGESDITVHAGSYHLALKQAGIEMCNIMTYSSILPGCARRVAPPAALPHGAVMETIMAVATADRGTRATAGISWAWLTDRTNGTIHGGLVCEYNGNLDEISARRQLTDSLHELYENGYSEDFIIGEPEFISRSFIPRKAFGTALVSLNFLNYIIPVLEQAALPHG